MKQIYRLAAFDSEEECSNTLESSSLEAYDEKLELYEQKVLI